MNKFAKKNKVNDSGKRMTIAFVSDSVYPFNKGGKEKRIYDVTTRIAAQGYDVTVYCMKWWEGEKTMMKDGVKFYAISPYFPLYSGKRRSIKEAAFFALNCLKLVTKDFDVMEVDHMPHLVLFTTKLVCLLRGKRMFATWHEVWGKDYWKQYLGAMGFLAHWIEKVSVKLPDTIISVSEHTTRELGQILGRTKNVVTAQNGLDIKFIDNSTPSSRESDIIYVGRLIEHKNVDVLIRAIEILFKRKSDILVYIVGEGPEKENLTALVVDLGLQKNIIFLPFFENHSDLYGQMKSSKVFVLPSTREGFGIVVTEANACGLPVVTINHPHNAAKDLIINGENGVLVELDDFQIAHAIEILLKESSGPEVYRAYSEKYNWDSIIKKYILNLNKIYSK